MSRENRKHDASGDMKKGETLIFSVLETIWRARVWKSMQDTWDANDIQKSSFPKRESMFNTGQRWKSYVKLGESTSLRFHRAHDIVLHSLVIGFL